MPFEELEHTADVKMRITAADYSSLLAEGGRALSTVLYGDYVEESSTLSVEVEAEGADQGELVVNFLSELLFQMEIEYLVPMSFELEVQDNSVRGIVSGVEFDRAKHAGGIGVKGISYSGLSLQETEGGFELQIIFDI